MTERNRPRGDGQGGAGGDRSRAGSGPKGSGGGSLRGSGASGSASASGAKRRAAPKGRPGAKARVEPKARQAPANRQPKRPPHPPREENATPEVRQPPAMVSFARGLGAVGGSPVVLVALFLAVLVLWLAYTSYGAGLVASSSVGLVQFFALPPARTFLDLGFLQFGHLTALAAIGFGVGLVVFRTLVTAFLIAAIDLSLRGSLPWRAMVAESARRMVRAFWVVLAIEVGFVAASLFVQSLTLLFGAQGGLLYFAWLIAGVYFFAYCEVVAVLEHAPLRTSLIWSGRAARLPGREHALLVFSYEILSIVVANLVPGRSIVTATPAISVWMYALFVAFLHVSVLAAFTWRWNVVAEAVKAGAGARGTRPKRPSLLGLGGARR